jgi:hypothetical protein
MGPNTGPAAPDDHDQVLDSVRNEFPGWDIHETLGGYIAVPTGTPVVRGMFLDTILDKLRKREGQP